MRHLARHRVLLLSACFAWGTSGVARAGGVLANGASVEPLGDSARDGGVSAWDGGVSCPRLAVGSDNKPWVGFGAPASTGQVYLKFWDGQRWAGVGGSEVGAGVSQGAGRVQQGANHTCLGGVAVDSLHHPLVAWMNWNGVDQPLALRRWDGGVWEELSTSAPDGGQVVWQPALVVDDADRPVVAWNQHVEAYVARWSDAGWTELGGSATFPGVSGPGAAASNVALAKGLGEELFLSWTEAHFGPAQSEIFLARWDGTAWGELGGSASTQGVSASGAIADWAQVADRRDGRPWLAWQVTRPGGVDIELKHWDGSTWASPGGTSSLRQAGVTSSDAFHPALVVLASGHPIVAWEQDDALGRNIYLARWDGRTWKPLGPSGVGGLSRTSARAEWPQLAVARNGSVFVLWQQQVGINEYQAYLKQLWLEPDFYRLGCGCSAGGAQWLLPAVCWLWWHRRRRAPRVSGATSPHGGGW